MSSPVRPARRALFGPRSSRVVARVWLLLGFAFLYLPLLALVVYSFNASPLPSVWGGFTLYWYRELGQDHELLAGF